MTDTIVAVATPGGRGAVGIVRLSGPDSRRIAQALCRTRFTARRATHAVVYDTHGAELDDAVVIYYQEPASYTGEDVVEIQCHGNPAILYAVTELACAEGARPATPGEFTQRAYLNGRMALLAAEAVADLINSHSLRAARAARRSLNGSFGTETKVLIERIQVARAHLEALIDFSDDTEHSNAWSQCLKELDAIRCELDKLGKGASQGTRLTHGISIAILGAPNVGKSSLLNCLAGHERAIVSPQAGTTRDLVDADIVIGALAARLVDTAGLRESTDAIEQEGMRRSREAAGNADLVLHVVDDSATASESIALDADTSTIVVHNKIDLRNEAARTERQGASDHVYMSALDGRGVDLLVKRIEHAVGVDEMLENEFSVQARHLEAIRLAICELGNAAEHDLQQDSELVAEHYRAATRALEVISGRYDDEALLGDIFSRFCIGK